MRPGFHFRVFQRAGPEMVRQFGQFSPAEQRIAFLPDLFGPSPG